MKYYEEAAGYKPDQLQIDGGIPFEVWNVKADGTVTRGDLLCAASLSDEFKLVSAAADAEKQMVIAAAGGSGTIQAYASGVFNSDKVNFGSLSAADFAARLREQNIILRG